MRSRGRRRCRASRKLATRRYAAAAESRIVGGEIVELQKEAVTAGIGPLAVSDQPLDHNSA